MSVKLGKSLEYVGNGVYRVSARAAGDTVNELLAWVRDDSGLRVTCDRLDRRAFVFHGTDAGLLAATLQGDDCQAVPFTESSTQYVPRPGYALVSVWHSPEQTYTCQTAAALSHDVHDLQDEVAADKPLSMLVGLLSTVLADASRDAHSYDATPARTWHPRQDSAQHFVARDNIASSVEEPAVTVTGLKHAVRRAAHVQGMYALTSMDSLLHALRDTCTQCAQAVSESDTATTRAQLSKARRALADAERRAAKCDYDTRLSKLMAERANEQYEVQTLRRLLFGYLRNGDAMVSGTDTDGDYCNRVADDLQTQLDVHTVRVAELSEQIVAMRTELYGFARALVAKYNRDSKAKAVLAKANEKYKASLTTDTDKRSARLAAERIRVAAKRAADKAERERVAAEVAATASATAVMPAAFIE